MKRFIVKYKILVIPSDRTGVSKFRSVDPHLYLQKLYPDEFWVDIGNYNSINDYNNEHLRNREFGDLYPQNNKWSWNWNSEKNRTYFESKRIQSDKLKLFSSFTLGALFVNHFVSSIDALYLKRLMSQKNLSIKPYIQNNDLIIGYTFEFAL